jgi:hypothetical protein
MCAEIELFAMMQQVAKRHSLKRNIFNVSSHSQQCSAV